MKLPSGVEMSLQVKDGKTAIVVGPTTLTTKHDTLAMAQWLTQAAEHLPNRKVRGRAQRPTTRAGRAERRRRPDDGDAASETSAQA
jgi:hypothetical protein